MQKHNYLFFRGGADFRGGSGYSVETEAGMCHALCRFLTSNGLNSKELPVDDVESWEGFELRHADVNALGLAVMQIGFRRWLRGIDKGKDPSDVGSLKRALKEVRKVQS